MLPSMLMHINMDELTCLFSPSLFLHFTFVALSLRSEKPNSPDRQMDWFYSSTIHTKQFSNRICL